jgi:hypothetical protein
LSQVAEKNIVALMLAKMARPGTRCEELSDFLANHISYASRSVGLRWKPLNEAGAFLRMRFVTPKMKIRSSRVRAKTHRSFIRLEPKRFEPIDRCSVI